MTDKMPKSCWLVLQDIPYEYTDILGAYTSKDIAVKAVQHAHLKSAVFEREDDLFVQSMKSKKCGGRSPDYRIQEFVFDRPLEV